MYVCGAVGFAPIIRIIHRTATLASSVFTTLYSGGFLYVLIYSLTTSSPHNVMQ